MKLKQMIIIDSPHFGAQSHCICPLCESQEPIEQEENKQIKNYYLERHAVKCGWRLIILLGAKAPCWVCPSCSNRLDAERTLEKLAEYKDL